jgi:hypothetical protein
MKILDKREPEAEERSRYYVRIGNEAIQRALEENRRLGLPNYFSRNGETIVEMPDGSEVILETGNKRKRPPEAA